MSNYAPPSQLWTPSPRIGSRRSPRFDSSMGATNVFVDVAAVNAFAQEWRDKQRGRWQEVERLAGFCLLLKREVIAKIGPAVEAAADLGLFDTDKLIQKARQTGFKLACCRDLFIHHFGTRTFAQGAPLGS
jgi:hypothetical protein